MKLFHPYPNPYVGKISVLKDTRDQYNKNESLSQNIWL